MKIPCGHAAADQEQARAVLGLPEGLFFAFVLSVGYPAYGPLAVIDRLNRRPFDEVVHRCRWGPPSASPAGIASYGANRVSALAIGADTWQWCNGRLARELSMLAGLGLITFEVAEVAWIGVQPIEGVFAPVGAPVLAFAAAWRQQ